MSFVLSPLSFVLSSHSTTKPTDTGAGGVKVSHSSAAVAAVAVVDDDDDDALSNFRFPLSLRAALLEAETTRAVLVSTSPYPMFSDGTQSTFDVSNKAAGLPEKVYTANYVVPSIYIYVTPFNCAEPLLPSLSTNNQGIFAMFSSHSWDMMKS